MKAYKTILISHACYILLTGLWPIVDIRSFMFVTGPKTDIWLVKTVGALLVPVGVSMLSAIARQDSRPIKILGSGIALAFLSIDVYYASTDVISDIYLADAVVEIVFLIGWIFLLFHEHRGPKKDQTV
jgi:hypothetical protein